MYLIRTSFTNGCPRRSLFVCPKEVLIHTFSIFYVNQHYLALFAKPDILVILVFSLWTQYNLFKGTGFTKPLLLLLESSPCIDLVFMDRSNVFVSCSVFPEVLVNFFKEIAYSEFILIQLKYLGKYGIKQGKSLIM